MAESEQETAKAGAAQEAPEPAPEAPEVHIEESPAEKTARINNYKKIFAVCQRCGHVQPYYSRKKFKMPTCKGCGAIILLRNIRTHEQLKSEAAAALECKEPAILPPQPAAPAILERAEGVKLARQKDKTEPENAEPIIKKEDKTEPENAEPIIKKEDKKKKVGLIIE